MISKRNKKIIEDKIESYDQQYNSLFNVGWWGMTKEKRIIRDALKELLEELKK